MPETIKPHTTGPVVRVGIGCFVTKRVDDTLYFLLGQRKGSHGSGTWALPGGHLEMGESWASCTQREVEEECGIRISLDQVHIATNNIVFNANKHYVDIVMASTGPFTGTVTLMEPEKCERWVWVTWQEVVDGKAVLRDACSDNPWEHSSESLRLEPLFLPIKAVIKQYGTQGPLHQLTE